MVPNELHLETIVDPAEASTILATSDAAVAPREGGYVLTRRAGAVAVPVESGCHFDARDVQRVAAAFQRHGAEELYAVSLERSLRIPSVYRLRASVRGVEAFNSRCAHFSYAIESTDAAAVILCSVDDYFVVIGEESFVSNVTGASLDEAFRAFEIFAVASEAHSPRYHYLHHLHATLHREYAARHPGETIEIP